MCILLSPSGDCYWRLLDSVSARTGNSTYHKIYGKFIWHHRVDTSLFRVVHIVNLNVKPCIRKKEAYMSPLL